MVNSRVLVDALQSSSTELKWEELRRQDASEYYGGERGAPMPSGSEDRMPEGGIGDEYSYRLALQEVMLGVSQSIYNSTPLTNHQHLSFKFGAPTEIADEGASTFDNHYAHCKMRISIHELHRKDRTHANLRFMNVPFAQKTEGWGRNDFLTPSGEEFMDNLISQREKLLAIAGLSDTDHETFARMLEVIELAYRSGKEEDFQVGYWST